MKDISPLETRFMKKRDLPRRVKELLRLKNRTKNKNKALTFISLSLFISLYLPLLSLFLSFVFLHFPLRSPRHFWQRPPPR